MTAVATRPALDHTLDHMAERGELDRPGVSRRLRDARDESGLTREQVAEILRVHRNTIDNWENPKRHSLPFDRLHEIGELYGVTKGWLLNGDDDEQQRQYDLLHEELREIRQMLDRIMRGESAAG